MKKEMISKLFKAYNTFNKEVNPEGTGLGLFIAKKLIEQLGP